MHESKDYKYYVDLHVHTRRYSPCAETLVPELIREQIRERHIHGVVITEHDKLWTKKEIRLLNEGLEGIRIYRGVEVSTAEGHFVVIGLEDLDGIRPGIAIEALIEKAAKWDAAIILAHHHLNNYNGHNKTSVLSMPQGIHAIEVASTSTFGRNQQQAISYAARKDWAEVAGSDAHAIECVGEFYTGFLELPADEAELARAIRTRQVAPIFHNHKDKQY